MILTCPVNASSETITWIFFVCDETTAVESMVAWLAEEGLVTTTAAVELPEETVYPVLEKAPFRSSFKRASSAPAVATDSAVNDAEIP